ncbi:tRNA-splicing endonuclease subunit Sen15 [Anabrus simplex]|uniref:tRNA-splicing endonuclease subunit Sen15 n=1 Tax=Anabrus simplex TaxID=316456 RepID=UPI0035A375DE
MNPIMKMLSSLGCQDQFKLAVAYHIYMELCEVMTLWDVQCHHNSKLDLIYFTAKRSKSSKETEIFVPHSVTSDITMNWIETVQNEICGEEVKKITLAMKHQDSSVVYYSLTQGMVAPDSPETSRQKKQYQDKRHKNVTELHRQRKELFEQAMRTGTPFEESSDEEL